MSIPSSFQHYKFSKLFNKGCLPKKIIKEWPWIFRQKKKLFLINYFGQRVWPPSPLKICPNIHRSKKLVLAQTSPPWFGQCPKFGSFFFDGFPKPPQKLLVLAWSEETVKAYEEEWIASISKTKYRLQYSYLK